MENNSNYRLFVIGASAGGFKAVVKCLGGFRGREDAVFLVVLHTFAEAPLVLADQMSRLIEMPVSYAENGLKIKGGQVFIARPDYHLMVKDGKLLFTTGPKVNLFRPSIDVLFRSAAVAYGNRVVGILLSGRLNDGTLGLSAIKRCGGITIVQDPASAEYGDMPLLAQKTVNPDFTLQLENMSPLLNHLIEDLIPPAKEVPAVLRREVEITSHIGRLVNREDDIKVEEDQPLSCPSCGGPLAVMEDEATVHYRCRTGHSFTLESLDAGQDSQLEETLWVALRVLDERLVLLKKMISDYERKGLDMLVKTNQDKLDEVGKHADQLKRLMGLVE